MVGGQNNGQMKLLALSVSFYLVITHLPNYKGRHNEDRSKDSLLHPTGGFPARIVEVMSLEIT